MNSKPETVVQAAKGELGSPYVFGAWGQLCTPDMRKKYAGYNPDYAAAIRRKCPVLLGKADDCEGCQFEGKRAFDCRGFTHWCLLQVGIDIKGGGATSQYNNALNWSKRGDIAEMPDVVCCVFMRNGKTMKHTGLHIGGGVIVHCSAGVQYGKVSDKGWADYAIPAGLYDQQEEAEARMVYRVGSKGDAVRQLQEWLNQLGYDCGKADGVYGTKTEAAVRRFQGDHGLAADGIAGDRTQAALTAEVTKAGKPSDDGGEADGGVSEPSGGVLDAVIAGLDRIANEIKELLQILKEGGAGQ